MCFKLAVKPLARGLDSALERKRLPFDRYPSASPFASRW